MLWFRVYVAKLVLDQSFAVASSVDWGVEAQSFVARAVAAPSAVKMEMLSILAVRSVWLVLAIMLGNVLTDLC